MDEYWKVKIYTKGAGNYISRKETNSRWSDKVYTIEKIDRDMTLQKYYLLEGLKRRYLRHELLMVMIEILPRSIKLKNGLKK